MLKPSDRKTRGTTLHMRPFPGAFVQSSAGLLILHTSRDPCRSLTFLARAQILEQPRAWSFSAHPRQPGLLRFL